MTTASAVKSGHTVSTESNTRHILVRAAADDSIIADSSSGHLVHESGYPDRWYLPRADVKIELTPSGTTSHCPFKGDASYWNGVLADGTVVKDVAWSYDDPFSDVVDVAGELSFWGDAVSADVSD